MSNTGNSNTDVSKNIAILNSSTLSQITSFTGALDAAASASGVSALAIAAPIAREINKVEVGDYNDYGLSNLFTAAKNSVALYGSTILTGTRLTEQEYEANLQYVRDNNLSNAQSAGLDGYFNRLDNPVLNDLGIAKIQLGTAMEAVSYYQNNASSFAGNDALDLLKYVNHTDQLAADLINPSTTMQVSISLQAVIAHQADQWASARIDGWQQYSDTDKAAFTAAYSTLGETKLNSLYQAYLDQGGDPAHYQPTLGQTSGSEYLTWQPNDSALTNIEALKNALTGASGSGSEAIDPAAYPADWQTVGVNNVPGVENVSDSFDLATGQRILEIFFGDQTTTVKISADSATIDSSDLNGVLQSQQDVYAAGDELVKYYNTNTTLPDSELDVSKAAGGGIIGAQVTFDQKVISAGGSIGEIFGSAIGKAIAGNNQFAQLAAGTVAGAIGQTFGQALSVSLLGDLTKVSVGQVFAGFGLNLAGAAAGSVASFLTAELGTALGLHGYGAQLFDAAVGGFAGSVLSQAVKMGLNPLITAIDWSAAAGAAEASVGGALGSILGQQIVHAQNEAGAVGGQLLGAIGSAIGVSLTIGAELGFLLDTIIPGIGSLIGTILGTLIGNLFGGSAQHPAATYTVDPGSYLYTANFEAVSASDGGDPSIPKAMAGGVANIVNAYLTAVGGVALGNGAHEIIGYQTDNTAAPYIAGELGPNPNFLPHYVQANDAVNTTALDLLRHTEAVGGDLLLKRAHQDSQYTDVVTLSGDLQVAEDYERYLNNRQTINALIAANPNTAFTAGWAATFARVNDLSLGQENASDFLGGLPGFLDSVEKAGLVFDASNVSVTQGSNGSVIVQIRVGAGAYIPGELSVFASQTNEIDDATGKNLQFVFNDGLAFAGFHTLAIGAAAGDGGGDLWFGNANAANNFNAAGQGGNEILIGGAAGNVIHAGDGWNFIEGGADNDQLYGGAGHDFFIGGGGNDTIVGGTGTETATYSGSRSNYLITYNATTQTYTIVDQRPGSPDGTDTVTAVGFFAFADVTLSAAMVLNPTILRDNDGNLAVVTSTDAAGDLSVNVYDETPQQNLVNSGTRSMNPSSDGGLITVSGSQYTDYYVGPTGALPVGGVAPVLNSQVGKYTSGAANGNTWINLYNSAGGLVSAQFNDENGSSGSTYINYYNSSGTLISSFGTYDNGAGATLSGDTYSTTYDPNGTYATFTLNDITGKVGHSSTNFYNGFGLLLSQSGTYGGATAGDTYTQTYNGNGTPASYSINDIANRQTYQNVTNNYDGNGNLLSQVGVNRDGSSWVYVFDGTAVENVLDSSTTPATPASSTTGSGAGNTYTTYYNSSGQEIAQSGSWTSGANAGDSWLDTFDATGGMVSHEFNDTAQNAGQSYTKFFNHGVITSEAATIDTGANAGDSWTETFNPDGTEATYTFNDLTGSAGASYTSYYKHGVLATQSGTWTNGANAGKTYSEIFGPTTNVVETGNNFFLDGATTGTGPELKYAGVPFVAGVWGAWTPIGAKQTATGYTVAWNLSGYDQYQVWNTDSSGNMTTETVGTVSGTSSALESLETSLNQDLNGDGLIGPPGNISTIESIGSTSLVQIGNNYFLDGTGGAIGAELQYNGAIVVVGQFGAYVPIGAEQTSTGYEVAWKGAGTDQYSVWSTDSNGNYTGNFFMPGPGTSSTLEALEPSFHQDLNGDGVIGLPGNTSTIESFGSTSLVRIGQNYYLNSSSSGGPELMYGGAPLTEGEFSWTPIGAEQTSTGYELALTIAGANLYTVWNVLSNGTVDSDSIGPVSGTSPAMELLETSFHQDLNGDGVIGQPIESSGSTSLVQGGNNYYLYANSTDTGPELKYAGVPFVAGVWGAWTPIGVEATATGYVVAWNLSGYNQYQVWNTDSSGNMTTEPVGTVSGTSMALEFMENTLHQDLNGDGTIGIPSSTVIESSGSTSLVQVGNDYYLLNNSTGLGPEVTYGGAPLTVGEFVWTPIGAEQLTSGAYQVALYYAAAGLYTVWTVLSNGAVDSDSLGNVSGASPLLESLESSFHQDLNGDGVIGLPANTGLIESSGSTSLVGVGNNYYFYSNSSGTGPELQYQGSAVAAGQFGTTIVPIGAEQTSTGYDVAWKNTSTNQYTVWSTDSNGSFLSNILGSWVSGASPLVESLESSFHQDLNGDGVIGFPANTTLIESSGSSSLVQVGSDYYLYANSTGTGPELKYAGVPFVAGVWGAWKPIGVEQTATGYTVAWNLSGYNQYQVWNTDSSGNMTTEPVGTVSGTSMALEFMENTLHQDLNGDGTIGIPSSTVIESSGSTSLVQVGNDYYLLNNSTGLGPEVTYGGAPLTVGEFVWTPIGAEQLTSGAYQVALYYAAAGLYTVWTVLSNGAVDSDSLGNVSGASPLLESLESSFHQDLNGDGVIGLPANTGLIESSGSTSLVGVGNNYYFYSNSTGTGPELKYGGAAVVTGQAAPWTPIGVEQTSTGYDVAWKNTSTNQGSIWSTDSSGNFLSYLTGAVSGTSIALEFMENTFHQDLNGDGTIGIPSSTVIESSGSTSLVQVGNDYYLLNSSTGLGPELIYGGAPVVAGQFGAGLLPIGTEQTSTGYDVVWKNASTNQFTVWSTDSNGNFISNITGSWVSGTSITSEFMESTFHQDLNGDGTIGIPSSTVIESFGSTSLVQVGNDYYLLNNSTGLGPEVTYGGPPLTVGEFAWTPIGAEQLTSGAYEVALYYAAAGLYTAWTVLSNGAVDSNLIGAVPGSSAALKSLEPSFHQDLNGDGVIGGSPVILDLAGNGINLSLLGASNATFDMSGDGQPVPTAWAGAGDGFLAIDLGANGQAGPDGVINQAKEIEFTQWAPGTTSDMQALQQVFDTDHNGELDPGDALWSDFRVWQDANGNGISDPGEVKTLDQLGITSINLNPTGPAQQFADGSAIQGLSTYTLANGKTGVAADVTLAYGAAAASPTDPTSPPIAAGAAGDQTFAVSRAGMFDSQFNQLVQAMATQSTGSAGLDSIVAGNAQLFNNPPMIGASWH
jgi:20S proteasome alpha/beta subunit